MTSFVKHLGKCRKRAETVEYFHSFDMQQTRAKNINYSRRNLHWKFGENLQISHANSLGAIHQDFDGYFDGFLRKKCSDFEQKVVQ